MIVPVLVALLASAALAYTVVLYVAARRQRTKAPSVETIALGAATNFLDTLGIGSFAPTTAWLRLRRSVPDIALPATLNTGHALPTIVQALIFIQLVRVDPFLLAACIGAAILGAAVGAPLSLRLPTRSVRLYVGVAMLAAALLYALANLDAMPAGGDALSLPRAPFVVAVAAHFALGVLMTLGIGLYAPSLVLLSLLGLNPTAAFPIMMGACAFLMPVAGARFAFSERIDLRVAVGLAVGGIPAVLLAAWVVRSLPLAALRWGVVVVVLYTGVLLLRDALGARRVVSLDAFGDGSDRP